MTFAPIPPDEIKELGFYPNAPSPQEDILLDIPTLM